MKTGERAFLDTSLLVAISVEAHPGHEAGRAYLARMVPGSTGCISEQVCREFLSALTRASLGPRVNFARYHGDIDVDEIA